MFLSSDTIDHLRAGLGQDCLAFLPELIVCGSIVLLLLMRLVPAFDRWHLGLVALTVTAIALQVSYSQWNPSNPRDIGGSVQIALHSNLIWLLPIMFVLLGLVIWRMSSVSQQGDELYKGFMVMASILIAWVLCMFLLVVSRVDWGENPRAMFSGLLVYDNFTIFLRLFLLGFTTLVICLSLLTGIPDREDSGDFYVLLLGATLGMMLMASSNHFLMVFIAVEMASLPSYALAGYLKGRRQSSEASLKYVVYGGGASGIMLYGISLIAGKFGTGYLPDLAKALPATTAAGLDPILLLGLLFILIGLAFKLSAVPFHFWCPDVFEGASAEVAAFLSVGSKGAALALLGRLILVLVPGLPFDPSNPMFHELIPVLAFFAALTATFGNLAAYAQTNLKQLSYSTIAHAGYMMMGLAPMTADGAGAVLFYLIAYLFMNLGAFAVIAFLRNQTGSEELASFRGLIHRSPVMVITLAIFLLSLVGLPPLAGFAAKFQIFRVLFDAGRIYTPQTPGLGFTMYALLVIGGLNTVFSLVYYLKVLKVMILERPLEEIEGLPVEPLPIPPAAAFYATFLAAMILVIGLAWNPLAVASDMGVDGFMPKAHPTAQVKKTVEVKP